MKVAAKNWLVFNSGKCTIKTDSITFFGMIYTAEGVKPDPAKIKDLQEIPQPTSKKEVQEFLGFIYTFRPLHSKKAEKTAPLLDPLKKESNFFWGEGHYQDCFQQLKNIVSEKSTLQYFDTNMT